MIKQILEVFPDAPLLIADGFDTAIIGLDLSGPRLIYSVTKCLSILEERDGMGPMEAVEFFEYNVRGAHVGDGAPIWCEDDF